MYPTNGFQEYTQADPALLALPATKQDLHERLADAYEAGGAQLLRAISCLLETLPLSGELSAFRKLFYEDYNAYFSEARVEDQVLTLGDNRWRATWIAEPHPDLGCFWTCQRYTLNQEKGEWIPVGGGPLQGNPQTEKEARRVLLEMAAHY
jgi:hypothetical protein